MLSIEDPRARARSLIHHKRAGRGGGQPSRASAASATAFGVMPKCS
jgi:hypothetical protein